MKKEILFLFCTILILNLIGIVYAEKLDISVQNSYLPGEELKFKLILYDDQNNLIEGKINYELQDYYVQSILEGSSDSGEEISYVLPLNARQGPWEITARHNNLNANRFFNVGALQKVNITLEGDVLTVKNVGNSVYDNKILIYIGDNDQTAQVLLEIGQEKKIRLTAPTGNYDIRISEGNTEKVIEFRGVGLTGNVVGLERVFGEEGFWNKYPIVSLFLGALALVIVIVAFSRFHRGN